jgi:hypothetical protein
VDPTVQLLRKKDLIFKQKRANRNKTSMPPIGTPSWCLSIEALEKFGRPTDNIPNYDPEGECEDIEDIEDENSDYQNDESDNNIAESSRKKKKKKKQKRRKKQKQKRKEKRIKTRK